MADQSTIMLVDDCLSSRDHIADILTAGGYSVFLTNSAEHAIACIDEQSPHLILLAVHLNGMSGFEACRALKRRKHTRAIPVILVNSSMDASERAEGFQMGAVDFITIPVDPSELLMRVKTQLELRRFHLQREQRILKQRLAIKRLKREVTARQQAESQCLLHSAAINAADDPIAILDGNGRIVFANNAYQRQTGCSAEEIIGNDPSALWPQPQERRSQREAWAAIRRGSAWCGEIPCVNKDGTSYTADVTITPVCGPEGGTSNVIVIARNITARKEYEGMLDYRAHRDELTGLPNRGAFYEELASSLMEHKKKGRKCAVLYIDLDKFKIVNDTMGHEAGDALLTEAAARLGACLREGDVLARMGGDEFTVLLRNVHASADAEIVAKRMLEQVSTHFMVGGRRFSVGASIGISAYPDDARDAAGLLRAADAAMYMAKELGRNNCQFYSYELSRANLDRAHLENDLRYAVEENELQVYYQPIVDARTMRIKGAEALLRWFHPEKGMISPGLFIPMAEENGLILQMGRMVLETACKQCKTWQGLGFPDLEMSVNVSPIQLRRESLPLGILDILDYTGLSPQLLNLEITETVLAKDQQGEMDALGRLNELGIKTCLDDFGTGYSSLSRLKDLPIVHMKVDGSFVRNIENNANDRAMTESIVVMAHKLGINVTAECVENNQQMDTLRTLDCDYAQGHLISPALPAEEFESFIQEWSPVPHRVDAA